MPCHPPDRSSSCSAVVVTLADGRARRRRARARPVGARELHRATRARSTRRSDASASGRRPRPPHELRSAIARATRQAPTSARTRRDREPGAVHAPAARAAPGTTRRGSTRIRRSAGSVERRVRRAAGSAPVDRRVDLDVGHLPALPDPRARTRSPTTSASRSDCPACRCIGTWATTSSPTSGTPIVAPFDGYASASLERARRPRGAGHRSSRGYVYNAHLSSYGTLGTVRAGTVVGYVGATGDATTAHDHLEWHPGRRRGGRPAPLPRRQLR